MAHVRWSHAALVLISLASCSSEEPPIQSDRSIGGAKGSDDDDGDDDDDDGDDDDARDAGSKRDASNGSSNPGKTLDAGQSRDTGSARDVTFLPPANCGEQNFRTASTVPDMLIVLDRSGSMRPDGLRDDLRCDMIDPIDFVTFLECAGAGIDCTIADWQETIYCGGTKSLKPIDRWAPSVTALTELTRSYDQSVAFGLMTFPYAMGRCDPGQVQVPLDTGTAAAIGDLLMAAATAPSGGGTPTGESLKAALETFQSMNNQGDGRQASAQYVLLVTDGQPTCPSAGGGVTNDPTLLAEDKQLTLDALDALFEAGIKTFVVGYDAELDPQFADALSEFAQHGGTDDYYPVIDQVSLVTAFQSVTKTVISCDFKFEKTVEDPSYLLVKLDDKPIKPDDPNGWSFKDNTVTVQGESCTTLQAGRGHHIEITLECIPPVIM